VVYSVIGAKLHGQQEFSDHGKSCSPGKGGLRPRPSAGPDSGTGRRKRPIVS
jgi:hypothetical protein